MATKLTIALELKALAPTQYLNYGFNSMCVFNGKLLGANENGLFELDGETDNTTNISAYFIPVNTDFDEPRQKRVTKIGLFGYSQGNIKATVIYDDYESEYSNNSIFSLGTSSNQEDQMLEFPINGLDNGRFVSLKFENMNGADFTVDAIDADLNMKTNQPRINTESGRMKKSIEFMTLSATATVV